MTLYTQLHQARSEEDVKDTGKCSSYAMFTQLLHYVQVALDRGDTVPPFLAVIDTEKAALMKRADALLFLARKTITWGKSASQYTQKALDENGAPVFSLGGKNLELGNREGYRQFWAIYQRPPKSEYPEYIVWDMCCGMGNCARKCSRSGFCGRFNPFIQLFYP